MKRNYFVQSFFEYVLCLFLVLQCNSVYTRLIGFGINISKITIIIVALFSIVILLGFIRKKTIKRKEFLLFFLELLIGLVYMILSVRKNISMYIVLFLLFFPLITFYFSSDNERISRLLKKIVNVVFALCIVSLVFYVFGTILHIIPSKTVLVNWGGLNYHNSYLGLHFEMQREDILGRFITRNTGVFTEAPMFSYVIVLALIFNMYINGKKYVNFIFIITILSTLSSTGIICVIMFMLIKMLFEKTKSELTSFIKLLSIPLVVFVAIYGSMVVIENKINSTSKSYSIRLDDYRASILAWKDSPIWGNNFTNEEKTISYMENYRVRSSNSTHKMTGQSNTVGRLLSEGGIILFMLYIFPVLVLIIKSVKEKNYRLLLMSLIFGVLLILTNVPYNYITLMTVGLCYAIYIQNQKKEGI